jgi:hypothetical protein
MAGVSKMDEDLEWWARIIVGAAGIGFLIYLASSGRVFVGLTGTVIYLLVFLAIFQPFEWIWRSVTRKKSN